MCECHKHTKDQTGAEHNDITIIVGHKMVKYTTIKHRTYNKTFGIEKAYVHYNVSEFLRRHESDDSRKYMAKVESFTKLLDAKVHIDADDQRYAHIYQGIDIIVKRVVAELTKLDSFFAKVKLRQTGSITSGVNVGLPHESDYALELPNDKI